MWQPPRADTASPGESGPPAGRITDAPEPRDFVRFRPEFGQRFLVTVDTEEEFDWRAPLRSSGYTLHALSRLPAFQAFCESHGVAPVYLMDYPVATSGFAADLLRDAVAGGRAEVGVQLHPWVNPPFEEEVTNHNSFAGNLPPQLEQAKFLTLRDAIAANFGQAPQIYRAGRYGVGPATAAMLRRHGIAIDTSVRARFDYAAIGGPDFGALPVRPWWVGGAGGLLELPPTTVFAGRMRRHGAAIYPRLWRVPWLRGALSRARLLERIPLTPEGTTVAEAARGIRAAVDEGIPVLVLSFHSPSLQPGHTPYVRSEADVGALHDWLRTVFGLLAALRVRPATVAQIMTAAELA